MRPCSAAWNAGVERAPTAAGAVASDEVRIMDVAFEFEPAGWVTKSTTTSSTGRARR